LHGQCQCQALWHLSKKSQGSCRTLRIKKSCSFIINPQENYPKERKKKHLGLSISFPTSCGK
jgi:hypothetical protein